MPADVSSDFADATGREARRGSLETGDPGVVVDRSLAADGLQQILRKNLEAIVAAAGD